MKRRNFRIGRLTGAAALAVLAPVCVPVAEAQQQPSPTPTPRARPDIVTLPGANNFNLQPSGAQPTQRAAQPTPTPAPTVARPTPTPSAATARATPTPRPTATAAARTEQPAAAPMPTSAASPNSAPTPDGELVVTSYRATPPVAEPTFTPVPALAEGGVPWLWILIGATMASVLVALGWLLGRRRAAQPAPRPAAVEPPRPAPPPPAAAPPPPPPAPKPAPRPALPPEPIQVELRPVALDVTREGAILDFELAVVNASNAPIDAVRLAFGLISAAENQDEIIAGFHATRLQPAVEPFKLGPREELRIPGRVGLEADRINVIEVGGRPMFVPLLMVDLRWQAGLSLKHQGSDFMIGAGRQGDKLGPVWLETAQKHERLNANRYLPQRAVAAA